MRFVVLATAVAVFSIPSVLSAGSHERIKDLRDLSALETKAAHAPPRERCFYYAKLVHSITELVTAQMQAGQEAQASASLALAQSYASKIDLNLEQEANAKKLKSAEILIRQSAFRMKELLIGASLDERPLLGATLRQLNAVDLSLMLEVLRR